MKKRVTTKITDQDRKFMKRAIGLAESGMNEGIGGPFGAIVVNADGQVIGEGSNKVTSTNDPTAHAEITAIRDACATIGEFQLKGCTIYTSCEPCPMCLGAIYWARPERIFFAGTKQDAAAVGFDDQFIYDEIELGYSQRSILTIQLLQDMSVQVFQKWSEKQDKIDY